MVQSKRLDSSTGAHVLLVEDERDIRELLRYNLTEHGYKVTCAASGEDGVDLARSRTPDVVLLDLMLPTMDGLEVCRQLRRDPGTQAIPVIMLTAKGEERDIVAGLETGADDYVTKPFSPRVLLARIKTVLRRRVQAPADEHATLYRSALAIDPGRHEVRIGDQSIELTRTEFRILHLLARRPGLVFTRSRIVHGVQGSDVAVTDRSVDVHIVSLRRKLGLYGKQIETVRGVGYRFHDA